MGSMIERGLDWLHGKLHDPDIAGEPVTYRRSGFDPFTIYVVIGKPISQPQTLLGFQPSNLDSLQANPINTDHDFWIRVKDLRDNNVNAPEHRDQIVRTIDGQDSVYEVLAPSSGDGMYKPESSYDKRFLVHTKFIRKE